MKSRLIALLLVGSIVPLGAACGGEMSQQAPPPEEAPTNSEDSGESGDGMGESGGSTGESGGGMGE
ncbi:MAG: hypothetical protein ACOC04_01965, partial [Halothece sp.]